MEEILASIRRIIADDQSLPGRPNIGPRLPDPAHNGAEAVEAETDTTRHGLQSSSRDGEEAGEPTPPSSVTAAPFASAKTKPTPSTSDPDLIEAREALFSAATDSSVKAAFSTLAATRIVDSSEELMELAREMIRPLLKAWIDEHLPSLVERMIVAEIERIARRSR